VLFGATVPFASRLADDTTAPMLAGLLYLGAALAVVPFLGRPHDALRTMRRGGWRLAIAVIAGGLLGPLALTAGLTRTPAATASLLLNVELVATAVLAAVAFGEHIGRRVGLGVALVVTASAVVGWSDTPELRVGALLIVAACLCWGVDNVVTARLDTVAPGHITLAKGTIAGTTNVCIALGLGAAWPGLAVTLPALALGAVGYGASITLWVAGARELGAARGQLVFSAAPFVGVLIAWTAFGDPATLPQAVALAIAGIGVSLVLGSAHEHQHQHVVMSHIHEHEHDAHHQHRHDDEESAASHVHEHAHEPLVHAHPHVPDLHHRHVHQRLHAGQ
jgi:drug/metabolite transporter (DMT)-like permease